MSEYEAIKGTLEEYARAYCLKDIDALMRVFNGNDQISVIGTGEDELCCGRSGVRALFLRNFAEATVAKFQWGWSDIQVFGNYAVVAQCLVLHLNTENGHKLIPIRWSVVLTKTDRWVWLHRHASTPSTSQAKGRAYPESA